MKKILLIEDNMEIRENTAEILELAHYKVDTAENGKIGVEMAKEMLPDLIICDIMMPELDGYGVLHIVGKDPHTASIPFIFLTAKAEKSDYRKGMNMGADDYLTKPFDEMELLDAIEVRLKKNDTIRKEFSQDINGLNEFLQKARGLDQLNELSERCKTRVYKKKDIVFREGEYSNYLYFVNSGKMKTFKMNDDGKEYVTGLHKSGDFIGYLALLEDSDYTETATVLEEAEIGIIPRQDFLALLYKNRDVAQKFIKMMSSNLVEKEAQLLNLAYDTVRKRVADALLLLQERYREQGDKDFQIAISRDDLASLVGTAKESVIRTLSEFKKDKVIDITSNKIIILQPDQLARLKY